MRSVADHQGENSQGSFRVFGSAVWAGFLYRSSLEISK
jgi:hypothetical protein